MKAESIVFAVAGMFFGVILGWVIASQIAENQAPGRAVQPAAPAPAAAGQPAPVLDQQRVDALMAAIKQNPNDAGAHVELGNAYFDAERWQDAIPFYERAFQLDSKNPNVSTDLGVAYYQTNRTDDALAQFDKSLAIDPTHTKTLLNKGIVLAFGKEDLNGASEEWKKVVALAPDSPEGQAARRALEGVAAAHAGQAPDTATP
jgi:tetratricopeptide (TPR) repeat protein